MRVTGNAMGFIFIATVVLIVRFLYSYYKNRCLEKSETENSRYYVDAQGNRYLYNDIDKK